MAMTKAKTLGGALNALGILAGVGLVGGCGMGVAAIAAMLGASAGDVVAIVLASGWLGLVLGLRATRPPPDGALFA